MASGTGADLNQRTVSAYPLPGYGPVVFLVRTRMIGGVGRGGGKPPLTRLGFFFNTDFHRYDNRQNITPKSKILMTVIVVSVRSYSFASPKD
jgi:hypothetical protein